MKKSLKLAIIGVIALTAGVSLSNNSYTAGIVEDTKDAYDNIGVNVKKASIGTNTKVDVSRTYVQYGSEGTRSFIRFATAISGPVKSIKYVRTVAGLGTKEKEVTTVYKGIQAAGGVYYYDGSQVVTTSNELTDKYYWACYTIEFTSDTYKAADITAYIVVESEEEGAEVIESTPRTESYENLKADIGESALTHPARFALIEVVNIHDEAMKFEPIYRVAFDVDSNELITELEKYLDSLSGDAPAQTIEYICSNKSGTLTAKHPVKQLTVGTLQDFLDAYISSHKGASVDYIHGENSVKSLVGETSVGFIFSGMSKAELFKTVIYDGALPRKTFSMGHAEDKRYYLECRKIK